MDFYIAALGRSGSTALANWLTTPPTHVVFHEPGLGRDKPTRLLQMQLDDWGMTRSEACAGHWAAKEIQGHAAMIDAFHPPKVILSVRRVADAALSLFEKHRRQGSLDRYSDAWAADYLVRATGELMELADRLDADCVPWRTFRYEQFGADSLRSIAEWVGWPGGSEMSRGFQAFDRAFEIDRNRDRELPSECHRLADEIAEQCRAFEERFYGS